LSAYALGDRCDNIGTARHERRSFAGDKDISRPRRASWFSFRLAIRSTSTIGARPAAMYDQKMETCMHDTLYMCMAIVHTGQVISTNWS
jgi:hypothetical protein